MNYPEDGDKIRILENLYDVDKDKIHHLIETYTDSDGVLILTRDAWNEIFSQSSDLVAREGEDFTYDGDYPDGAVVAEDQTIISEDLANFEVSWFEIYDRGWARNPKNYGDLTDYGEEKITVLRAFGDPDKDTVEWLVVQGDSFYGEGLGEKYKEFSDYTDALDYFYSIKN